MVLLYLHISMQWYITYLFACLYYE